MKWSTLKLALIAVISLSQILLVVFYLTYKNVNVALGSWSKNSNLTIYLKADTSDDEKNALLQFLKKMDEKSEVKLISRASAAQDFQKSVGSYASGLLSEDELIDLVPETIELAAPKAFSLNEKIGLFQKVTAGLAKFPTVEESVFGLSWLQRFSEADRFLKTVGLSSFLILLLAMGFLAALMVRVLIEDSKAEVEVFNLLGATRWSIYKIYLKDLSFTILLSLAITFALSSILFFSARSALAGSDAGKFFANSMVFLDIRESIAFVLLVLFFIYLICLKSMTSSLKKLSHLTYD